MGDDGETWGEMGENGENWGEDGRELGGGVHNK